MPIRVGVIGSANMDLIAHTDLVPVAGQNVLGRDFLMAPGGKGANQAVAAARLGATVTFIGKVGADAFGEALMASLKAEGVDVGLVEVTPVVATGTALIVVDRSGENAITICPGANMMLRPENLDEISDVIEGLDVLLMQLELPMDTVMRGIALGRELKVRTIVDAGPPRGQPPAEFFNVSILSPNQAEAAALIGRPISTLRDAEAAASELMKRGAESVVLKLGEQGALMATPQGMRHFQAQKVKVVDTTGAGDAFTAALAVFVSEGLALPGAVHMANIAGALATTRSGAQPAMPTRKEIISFKGHA